MKYLTAPQVCQRYQICQMSLYRWQRDNKLAFPKPLVVNRRKLFREDELLDWERKRASVAA
ncbi:helix-turn-helix transcriptional regulator [Rhizobium grahamii]|uniref:Helix-turn-helix domain-containing protein n=1 Tax=Rhizobium grahamii TaxID=1120045 RepID=A0A370KRM2_9HYPH|nr:helix-turn-helix domain-containing protein [Rhizobium grahamii]RDJ12436.1 helix-turn-helix domain-containing protein [Rhizobium grahamii]